jgi:hypothetical protein
MACSSVGERATRWEEKWTKRNKYRNVYTWKRKEKGQRTPELDYTPTEKITADPFPALAGYYRCYSSYSPLVEKTQPSSKERKMMSG